MKLIADARTNSILLSGDRAQRLRMRALVAHLDTPLESGENTQVIYLRYAKASELVPILEGVADTLTGTAAKSEGANPATIQPHEGTNALIITSSPAVFRDLSSVVRQLDVPSVQILVEAIIAEVSDDLADELGVQWQTTTIDSDGNVWLADTESHSVRMINAKTGNLERIAGDGSPGDGPDGDPKHCKLARLHGIFSDTDGSIYIGDSEAHKIRVLTKRQAGDRIELVAGGRTDAVDIPATEALLKEPFGTAFDASNQLWIVEMASGNRLLKVDDQGILVHVAGQKSPGFQGDGGPAKDARFNGPHNLAIRRDGRVLIADTWNGRIRQVDPKSKQVDSLAGFEVPIEKAKSSGPYCISTDLSGSQLFVADLHRIHRIDLETGASTIVAGNGEKGGPKDGAKAVEASLADPRAVAADRLGNVYILERSGNALRVVRSNGTIETVVNASGKKGTETAERETAIDAMMNGPKHLCIDAMDRVVIADAENHLVRRYDPRDGTLSRIAGTGVSGSEGIGGRATACQLARPHGVTIHPTSGELYITDSYNNRILKIANEK